MINKVYTRIHAVTRFTKGSVFVRLVYIGLFALITFETSAQLQRVALPRSSTNHTLKNPAARTKAITPLSLPFWDDFSFTLTDNPNDDSVSNFPIDSLWAGSNNVYINNGMGLNAPSINVATFDGLNSQGLSYANEQTNGYRDTLVSNPIKLSDVATGERATVWLSFFYQWQGNGEAPDETDFLQLEFKDSTDQWESLLKIFPKSTFNRSVFYDTILQVAGDKYFHDNFQFRFINYGRRSGPFDTWNVDYIYLNKNRSLTSNSFPERAIASPLSPLFGDYFAVPLAHFRKDKFMDTLHFDVKNLKKTTTDISIGYKIDGVFWNYEDSVASPYAAIIDTLSAVKGELGGLMEPSERVRVNATQLPDTSNLLLFSPTADSIRFKLKVTVLGDTSDTGAPAFAPVDFTANDTVSATYFLKDYYAYDDGTAEYSVILLPATDKAAYAFDMITDTPDTLVSFNIYFPRHGLTGNRSIDYYIYGDNNGMPDDNNILTSIFSKTIELKGTNEFQEVEIPGGVVVSGRFYIAFKGYGMRLGLDASNNTIDRIFYYYNASWRRETSFTGSLMIRPIFGKGSGDDLTTGIDRENKSISVYPNPNRGEFYIERKNEVLQVITVTGKSINFETEVLDNEKKIRLHQTTPGLYILKMKQGNTIITQKIIVH